MRFSVYSLLGNWTVVAFLLLGCPNEVQGAPCQTLRTEASCAQDGTLQGEAAECTWCPSEASCVGARETCPEIAVADDSPGGGSGNQPCKVQKTQEDCQQEDIVLNDKCQWCPEVEECHESDSTCPGALIVDGEDAKITCPPLDETECAEASEECSWCTEFEKCRTGTDLSVACAPQGGSKATFCEPLTSEEDCAAAPEGCTWCPDINYCGVSQGACNSSNRPDGKDDEDLLDAEEDDLICAPLEDEGSCTALDTCMWCEDKEVCRDMEKKCPGQGGEKDDKVNCNPLKDEIECLETEGACFWCAEKAVCRSDLGQCPGASGNMGAVKKNICAPLKNETACTGGTEEESECFWCAEKELCRSSPEECPGQGRGNKCKDFTTLDTCEATADDATDEDEITTTTCLWSEDKERCFAQRGNPGKNNTLERDPKGPAVCPLLLNEANCTATGPCRWCTEETLCQAASEACKDGSLGVRGNPCRLADTEDLCAETEGCLWCANTNSTNKCRKANNDACSEDDDDEEIPEGDDDDDDEDDDDEKGPPASKGNPCVKIDFQPECDVLDECQWCEAQLRCKNNVTECEDPSGEVDLEIAQEVGGRFAVQDDGLGPTDPNAVSVALSYLYEVSENGTTIDASLVDLDLQEYDIKQTVNTFFGDIEAREISFLSTIPDVGTVEMKVYIMLSSGNVSSPGGEESWEVEEGDIKFNVELKNWTFCGAESPCGSSTEASAFVDLAFTISGSSETPNQSEENALLFNLGGNVPLFLSNVVEVDGFAQDMPDGFPRVESTESQGTVFVFRFPTFEESIEYDPIIPYSSSIPILTDGEDNATTTEPPTAMPSQAPVETDAPTKSPKKKPTEDEKDGMSAGAVVGVVFGVLIGLCCCCAAVGYLALRQREGGENTSGSDGKANATFDGDENFDDEEGRAATLGMMGGNIMGGGIVATNSSDDEDIDVSDSEEEDASDDDYTSGGDDDDNSYEDE